MEHSGRRVSGISGPCHFVRRCHFVRACALFRARHGRFVRAMVVSSFFGLWPVADFPQIAGAPSRRRVFYVPSAALP